MDDGVWDASTLSKNRERLMQADVAKSFMSRLLNLPDVKGLLSSEHFPVDGTLIDAILDSWGVDEGLCAEGWIR